MPHVVDTVALVRHLTDGLGAAAARILDDPAAELVFPTIVLAELKHIIVSKRLPLDFDDIASRITADRRCLVYPLDLDVVRRTPAPPALEMHDGIVYATSLALAARLGVPVPIVTCDRTLVASGAPTIW